MKACLAFGIAALILLPLAGCDANLEPDASPKTDAPTASKEFEGGGGSTNYPVWIAGQASQGGALNWYISVDMVIDSDVPVSFVGRYRDPENPWSAVEVSRSTVTRLWGNSYQIGGLRMVDPTETSTPVYLIQGTGSSAQILGSYNVHGSACDEPEEEDCPVGRTNRPPDSKHVDPSGYVVYDFVGNGEDPFTDVTAPSGVVYEDVGYIAFAPDWGSSAPPPNRMDVYGPGGTRVTRQPGGIPLPPDLLDFLGDEL